MTLKMKKGQEIGGQLHHGYYRKDALDQLRFDEQMQKAIVQREDEIVKKWSKKLTWHAQEWMKHAFKRQDPGT